MSFNVGRRLRRLRKAYVTVLLKRRGRIFFAPCCFASWWLLSFGARSRVKDAATRHLPGHLFVFRGGHLGLQVCVQSARSSLRFLALASTCRICPPSPMESQHTVVWELPGLFQFLVGSLSCAAGRAAHSRQQPSPMPCATEELCCYRVEPLCDV